MQQSIPSTTQNENKAMERERERERERKPLLQKTQFYLILEQKCRREEKKNPNPN